MTYRPWPLLTGLILVIWLSGCENAELQERFETRGESLDRTAYGFYEREDHRVENLERAGHYIDRRLERDAERTGDNPERVRAFFKKDFDHWNDRELERQRRITDLMKGKPDNIERTAIKIID